MPKPVEVFSIVLEDTRTVSLALKDRETGKVIVNFFDREHIGEIFRKAAEMLCVTHPRTPVLIGSDIERDALRWRALQIWECAVQINGVCEPERSAIIDRYVATHRNELI